MKFMTVIAVLFAVSEAGASEYVTKKMNWSPRTYNGGTATYYNCQSVESTVESHLEALGAQNIQVNCNGGIEMGWTMPANVTAKFDVSVTPGFGAVREITLKGTESCYLNSEFLDAAIPMFPGIKVLSKRASCSGGRLDRWSYSLSITE
jgi:hypothetical protein